jgi:putative SOS response-associated peptidase YedK
MKTALAIVLVCILCAGCGSLAQAVCGGTSVHAFGAKGDSATDDTATPNLLLSNFHDRMPVILHPENYAAWLTPGNTDAALEMLKPCERMMCSYPVSTRLNQVQNDDPHCAAPLELEAPPQGRLF